MVFDAAAKSRGVSFNDAMLTGPDLVNLLTSVLFKFREHKIGFCGDIREMFHLLFIREEDLPAQRLLWHGMDRNRMPDVYEMTIMTFALVCAPSGAQEIKNVNAKESKQEFPEAAKAIIERHYVDDYLDGAATEELAIKAVQDVTEVHRHGGFQICNWISSSRAVMQSIPPDLRAKEAKDMSHLSQLPSERVLVLHWNTIEDIRKGFAASSSCCLLLPPACGRSQQNRLPAALTFRTPSASSIPAKMALFY